MFAYSGDMQITNVEDHPCSSPMITIPYSGHIQAAFRPRIFRTSVNTWTV